MTENLGAMIVVYYGECFDFYEDVQNGEDEGSLLYDKGSMNAIRRVTLMLCDEEEHDETERLLAEMKDKAKKDASCKGRDEKSVVALVKGMMK